MTLLFVILLVLSALFIALFILIQNPKGGGMDSNIMGGAGNQIFGVQQSANILERGTWILGIFILVLCLSSVWFIDKKSSSNTREETYLEKMNLKK